MATTSSGPQEKFLGVVKVDGVRYTTMPSYSTPLLARRAAFRLADFMSPRVPFKEEDITWERAQ